MPSVSTVDDKVLVELISAATRRILLVTPGISLPVAEALCRAWRRMPPSATSVVLDVDPEVCRLGYGTEAALSLLQKTASDLGQSLCHEPGVRIAILIVDDRTVIYSPTPLLIEAQPNASLKGDSGAHGPSARPPKPNAIILGDPPAQLASDLGLTPAGAASRNVGLDAVDPTKVKDLKEDLAKNPPLTFNVSRYERVFNARIEFVELSVGGCAVSKRTVSLPSYLMGLANDETISSQLRNVFRVINDTDTVDLAGALSEQAINKKRKEISDTYLRPLKGFGVAILRTNRSAFEKEVQVLKDMVAEFAAGLRSKLNEIIDRNVTKLVESLLPAVMKNIPRHWTATLGPTPTHDACRKQLAAEVHDIVGNAEDLVRDMKVTLIFKGVTYQTLTEKDFIEIAKQQFPEFRLMEEYDAARGA